MPTYQTLTTGTTPKAMTHPHGNANLDLTTCNLNLNDWHTALHSHTPCLPTKTDGKRLNADGTPPATNADQPPNPTASRIVPPKTTYLRNGLKESPKALHFPVTLPKSPHKANKTAHPH